MEFTGEKVLKQKKGKIFSINTSKGKGTCKKHVFEAKLLKDFGLEGDAHGGFGDKQVSLLALESIKKQDECPKVKSKDITLKPGDFAENITTEGLEFTQLNIGDRLKVSKKVVLEISKIGKECHRYCAVYYKTGDCIMPREGLFAKVLKEGVIKVGDEIEIE